MAYSSFEGRSTITGSIAIVGVAHITGSVALTEPITGSVRLTEPITGSVALTEPITGSVGIVAAPFQHAEDTAAASTDMGVAVLEVRRDVPVSSASADGDYATKNQDADGYSYSRDKSRDEASNANRSAEIAPLWSRNVTAAVTIASAQNVTTSWVDLGAAVEVGTQGYKTIGLWLNIDINDSTNVRVRAKYKHTAADTDEYDGIIAAIDVSGTPFNTKVQPSYQEYDVDADGKVVLPYDVANYIPYVQFQVTAEVVGVTPAQIITAKVTYGY